MAPKAKSKGASSKTTLAGKAKSKVDVPDEEEVARKEAVSELLKELLGLTASSFTDMWVNLTNNHLYSMMDAIEPELIAVAVREAGVRGKQVDEAKIKTEVEKGLHKVITILENSFDHIFDMCEIYFQRGPFSVSNKLLGKLTLPHQRGLDLRPPGVGAGRPGARKDSEALYAREKELNAQIRAAIAAQHSLRLAQVAADRRLRRQELFRERFSMLLGGGGGGGGGGGSSSAEGIPSTLDEAACKLCADAKALLAALDELRALDPLGAALVVQPSAHAPHAPDDNAAAAGSTKPWEQGREGYLNWETDRLVAHAKAAEASTPAGSGKRKSGHNDAGASSSSAKRARTSSRAQQQPPPPPPAERTDFVGDPQDLEKLAADLKRH